jgi:hypothetical protein
MRNLFKRRKVKLFRFNTGTAGMQLHKEFVEALNDTGAEVISFYIEYHDYSNSHEPAYLNYVVKYYE